MSELREILADSVDRLFGDLTADGMPATLSDSAFRAAWSAVEETGVPLCGGLNLINQGLQPGVGPAHIIQLIQARPGQQLAGHIFRPAQLLAQLSGQMAA